MKNVPNTANEKCHAGVNEKCT